MKRSSTMPRLALISLLALTGPALASEPAAPPTPPAVTPMPELHEQLKKDSGVPEDILKQQRALNSVKVFPMTEEQMREYLRLLDEAQGALSPAVEPVLVSRTITMPLEPGSDYHALKVAPGFPVVISFVDVTGKPWPILSITAQSRVFSVSRPEVDNQNILTISANAFNSSSSLTVLLADADTPVSFLLSSHMDRADPGRVDNIITAVATRRGPNADPVRLDPGVTSAVDEVMTAFLDNTADFEGVTPIPVDDPEVRLWKYRDSMYLRTRLPKIWPAHKAVASGLSGIRAYEIPVVSRITLLRDGKEYVIETGDW